MASTEQDSLLPRRRMTRRSGHCSRRWIGLEARLSRSRYLLGDQLTEADIRLFTTLVRFDAVYHGHFKCNISRIVDYTALWRFTRDVYNLKDVAETVNM